MKKIDPLSLVPLLFLSLVLVVELLFGRRNVIIAFLIVAGLYLVFWLIFYLLGWNRRDNTAREQEKRPDPNSFAGFWSGEWIQSKGKRGWIPRFLFAMILPALFFGGAAYEVFSDGGMDLESTLVFLIWVVVGLGTFAVVILKNSKGKKQSPASRKKTAEQKRIEQLNAYLKNGLIDQKEYQNLRSRAERENYEENR